MTRLSAIATKEYLFEQLCVERLSFRQVAKLLGCSDNSVRRIANDYELTIPKRSLVDESFFLKDSAELFYVLGLLATDGYISDDGRIGIELIDAEVIDWIASTVKYKGSVQERQRGQGKPTYCLRFTSHEVSKRLAFFGITPRKSVSLDIKNIPREYTSDFVRGVFEGDGTVSLGQRKNRKNSYLVNFGIATSSSKFAEQIQAMVEALSGVKCNVLTSNTKTDVPIHLVSCRNLSGIADIARSLYSKDTVGMLRKKTKMLSIIEFKSQREVA